MDKLAQYRQAIKAALPWYISGSSPATDQIIRELVIDEEHDRYQVIRMGWRGKTRIFGPSIHLEIRNNKIWIEYDGTDRPIADELVEAGVLKEDIVLAFQPEELRYHTGFAVR